MTSPSATATATPTDRPTARPELHERCLLRLRELWRETGDENLLRLSQGEEPQGMGEMKTARDETDAVSSCLMTAFQETGNPRVFELLVELNRTSLLHAIRDRLRGNTRVDPNDVLQEALMSICRYRQSFHGDKPAAFRKWAHRIAINTACHLFKVEARAPCLAPADDIGNNIEDRSSRSPFRKASDSEIAKYIDFAYLTYLNLYLLEYEKRSPREQRALSLVELEGASYKETSADLGIRVPTLKMLIFRARQKIIRGIERSYRALPCSA